MSFAKQKAEYAQCATGIHRAQFDSCASLLVGYRISDLLERISASRHTSEGKARQGKAAAWLGCGVVSRTAVVAGARHVVDHGIRVPVHVIKSAGRAGMQRSREFAAMASQLSPAACPAFQRRGCRLYSGCIHTAQSNGFGCSRTKSALKAFFASSSQGFERTGLCTMIGQGGGAGQGKSRTQAQPHVPRVPSVRVVWFCACHSRMHAHADLATGGDHGAQLLEGTLPAWARGGGDTCHGAAPPPTHMHEAGRGRVRTPETTRQHR